MHRDDYSEKERLQELKFLENHIFLGLNNLNDGFDAERIFYFSESDFEIVLDRVEEFQISVYGIEPWLNKEFFDVHTYEDYNLSASDPKWYRAAFGEFKAVNRELLYSASLGVPFSLLGDSN